MDDTERFKARHEERELMGDIALEGFIDWCEGDDPQDIAAATLAREYLALRKRSRAKAQDHPNTGDTDV